MEFVDLVSRWAHVGAAIVLLGGSAYTRFVLMPAAGRLPDEAHDELRQRVMGTWRKFVGIGIGLLLLSGGWNYYRLGFVREVDSKYHMVLGIKMLLSLAVFFLASALVGRSKGLEGIRRNAKFWLGVLIALAAAVVMLAGFAKVHFG